jgi:hypothetical protein
MVNLLTICFEHFVGSLLAFAHFFQHAPLFSSSYKLFFASREVGVWQLLKIHPISGYRRL